MTHHEFDRYSHASYLLEERLKKRLPLEEIYSIIAPQLGDTIEVMQKTYIHLFPTIQDEIVDLLDNL